MAVVVPLALLAVPPSMNPTPSLFALPGGRLSGLPDLYVPVEKLVAAARLARGGQSDRGSLGVYRDPDSLLERVQEAPGRPIWFKPERLSMATASYLRICFRKSSDRDTQRPH